MKGQLAAFLLGYREGLDDFGMTYDDDPESPRSRAYDRGRSAREQAGAIGDGVSWILSGILSVAAALIVILVIYGGLYGAYSAVQALQRGDQALLDHANGQLECREGERVAVTKAQGPLLWWVCEPAVPSRP